MCLKYAVEYTIEFRAKIQSGDPNVGVVSIWMILKAMRSNEIIVKVDKKTKEEPWDTSVFRGLWDEEEPAKKGEKGTKDTKIRDQYPKLDVLSAVSKAAGSRCKWIIMGKAESNCLCFLLWHLNACVLSSSVVADSLHSHGL